MKIRLSVLVSFLVFVLVNAIATGSSASGEDLPLTLAQTVDPTQTLVPTVDLQGDGSSLASPLPVGSVGRVEDASRVYEIRVVETDYDAEERVLAGDPANMPAKPSHVMVMTSLEIEKIDTGPDFDTYGLAFTVIGSRGIDYAHVREQSSCGSVEDGPDKRREIKPGVVHLVNVCWQVPDYEIESMVMEITPILASPETERVFFSLGTPSGEKSNEVASPAAFPTPVHILLSDYLQFHPDEIEIPANTAVTFTLTNAGVLPHNFTILEAPVPTIAMDGGESIIIIITLEPGTYRIVCDVPGHTEAGQVAVLIAE